MITSSASVFEGHSEPDIAVILRPGSEASYPGLSSSCATATDHIYESFSLVADGDRSRIPSVGYLWEAKQWSDGGVVGQRYGRRNLVRLYDGAARTQTSEEWSSSSLDRAYSLRRSQAGRESIPANLIHLATRHGLRWTTIAETLRISIPALRKWRLGLVKPRRRHRERVASLVAFLDTLRFAGVAEPGGLLSTRLVERYTATLSDIFEPDRVEVLLSQLVDNSADREQMLDALEGANWRYKFRADVILYLGADGEQAMRLIPQR